MNRAILFRFHTNPEVCISQLRLLKKLNPDTPIYGLGEDIDRIEDLYNAGLESVHVIDDETDDWKWRNGDLAAAKWFTEYGHTKEFDVLHLIEWDLLLTKPLDELYSHIPEDGVAMTGAVPIENAIEYDWGWATGEHESEYNQLIQFAEDTIGETGTHKAGLFPGATFPREFLQQYSSLDIPILCNDEVRIGVLSEALGYTVYDTGWYIHGCGPIDDVSPVFNCVGESIDLDTVYEQQHDAYHPVREPFDSSKF